VWESTLSTLGVVGESRNIGGGVGGEVCMENGTSAAFVMQFSSLIIFSITSINLMSV